MTHEDLNQFAAELSDKKRYLSGIINRSIRDISQRCLPLLEYPELLDRQLQRAIQSLPYCSLLYVTDTRYRQRSSNVARATADPAFRGQDLAERPYLQGTIPLKGLVLSNGYIDKNSERPCITLVQSIEEDGQLQGLLFADFDLDAIPLPDSVESVASHWKQFKGDPVIRSALFNQQRVSSMMDEHINNVHAIAIKLLQYYGVFHVKFHYSSSRVTLWMYNEPHHYRLHSMDELLSERVFDLYPPQDYPEDACVETQVLEMIFDQFVSLRFVDENIYLRSASVNIINGLVGLTFSCDGSHYLPASQFVTNSLDYWLGSTQIA